MKNKTLRILSLGLATTTALSTSTPAFAYNVDEHDNSIESVEYQNTEDKDFNNVTNVFAQLGSEYKVTIPKIVVLSGVSKAASYYVKVEGDIAGYEKINVVPEDSFKLSAKNKADEAAIINQDKTTWTVHDFDTDANGQISAEDITAGKWTGAFNFNINLEDTTVPKVLAAGLYDENDNLIKSWDELVELGLDVEKNYDYNSSKTAATSGYSVFTNNNLSGKLVISDSVAKIGNYALYGCTSLTSITIPNSVTSIGKSAFGSCKKLTSITIPDSVTNISNYAFDHCSSLESITIPDSVTSIGEAVFWGCTSLKNLTIPNSVTLIGVNAFDGCTSLESITIPDSVTNISNHSFNNCTSLESVILGKSVTSIGNSAFSYCKKLTSITIPDSVTSIGDYAFDHCSSLESIIIPDSVTSIGNSAFANCTSLESIIIPDSVTSIREYTFSSCKKLTSITIPDSVTSIGYHAFAFAGLTSITIPDSVTSIGYDAFRICSSLESITYRGVTYTNKNTFNNKLKSDGVATKDVWI